MSEDETVYLLANWKQGDKKAAEALFERYVNRLMALARGHLPTKLRARVDPEDVVQSVYRVFFNRASQDEFIIERSGDLWRLLAAITIKKVLSNIEFHQAKKRSFSSDVNLIDEHGGFRIPVEAVSNEPGPDEGLALMDELQSILGDLDPTTRQVMELRLQGCSIEEISAEISRSDRTVRRALEQTRKIMEQRLLKSE